MEQLQRMLRFSGHVFLILGCLILMQAHGQAQQELRGRVFSAAEGDTLPLPYAHIQLLGTSIGVTSDSTGRFALPIHGNDDFRIVASHVRFIADTTIASTAQYIVIVLHRIRSLDEVSVTGERKATSIAPIEFKTEIISRKELLKAPCCDLSGCFSTNTSVEPVVTDVIIDTKELRMIGLSGVYTQILVDNVPSMMTGLNYSYGLNFIPGTIIDRIFIVKGINSVLQGYEAISGQVNVLLRDRNTPERFFLNTFANSFLEKQITGYGATALGNWHTLFAAHMVQPGRTVDADHNSFVDVPLITRYALYNKWETQDDEIGFLTRGAISWINEKRVGGQPSFDADRDEGSSSVYGQVIRNNRFQVYNKMEFLVEDAGKINIHIAASTHRQDAFYGATSYEGNQVQFFGDADYIHPFSDEHTFTAGASYSIFRLLEDIRFISNPLGKSYDGSYRDVESVPGVFVEDKIRFLDDRLTFISGLRLDFHSRMGTFATPRFFAKYDPFDNTVLRFSVGSGSRYPRIFSENTSLLASWRDVIIDPDIVREEAVNVGGSITQYYQVSGMSGSLIVDLYHTGFTHQVVADFDTDPAKIIFRNLDVRSVSDHLLIELAHDITSAFDVKIGYTFTDAYERHDTGKKEIPFHSRHMVMAFLNYEIASAGLAFNAGIEWHGSQQLPDTRTYPEAFRLPGVSDPFSVLNVQISKSFDTFEVYLGAENLFDTRQPNPILNARHPFERYFEPTFAWGPVKGREWFGGLRLRIHRDEDSED